MFREYGPLSGDTLRARLRVRAEDRRASSRGRPSTSTRASTSASRPTACWPSASAASRAGATIPSYLYYGGNSELRGYEYLEFIGNKAFFANAELRFPLIEAALTPLGVVGGLRAVAFANLGASQLAPYKLQVWTKNPTSVQPILGYTQNPFTGEITPVLGPPTHDQRLPPGGRPRLLRHRPRDLRARLPDPLRLVVADAASTRAGKTTSTRTRRRSTARAAAASGCASRSSRFGSATISRR